MWSGSGQMLLLLLLLAWFVVELRYAWCASESRWAESEPSLSSISSSSSSGAAELKRLKRSSHSFMLDRVPWRIERYNSQWRQVVVVRYSHAGRYREYTLD